MNNKIEINNVVDNLKKLGYIVNVFDTKENAKEYLLSSIKNKTISFGGSQTIANLNLKEELAKNNTLYMTDKIPEGETSESITSKIMSADYFMLSCNAMTLKGEIVNLDGIGNRLAGSLYGHKKIYYILGDNKICNTMEEAVDRVRNIASPKNCLRLHKLTPCALKVRDDLEKEFKEKYNTETIDQPRWAAFIESIPNDKLNTHCFDCASDDRICRSLCIHLSKIKSMEAEVIIIKEKLGY